MLLLEIYVASYDVTFLFLEPFQLAADKFLSNFLSKCRFQSFTTTLICEDFVG